MADDHLTLTAYVGGKRMKKLTSITFNSQSGNVVITTLEDFAGFSDGPGLCTVALESAIPASGQEFAYQQTCAKKEWVELQIPIGGDGSFVGTGKFDDVGISQSTTSAAGETINWTGELKAIK